MKIVSHILNNKSHSSYYSVNRMTETINSRLVRYVNTAPGGYRVVITLPSDDEEYNISLSLSLSLYGEYMKYKIGICFSGLVVVKKKRISIDDRRLIIIQLESETVLLNTIILNT